MIKFIEVTAIHTVYDEHGCNPVKKAHKIIIGTSMIKTVVSIEGKTIIALGRDWNERIEVVEDYDYIKTLLEAES